MSRHLLKKLSIDLDSKGLDLGWGDLRNQKEAVCAPEEI